MLLIHFTFLQGCDLIKNYTIEEIIFTAMNIRKLKGYKRNRQFSILESGFQNIRQINLRNMKW